MPETKTLPSVRDHADALIGEMVKDGRIAPDSDAAAVAAGIPNFSKGTATLDPNTGQPVAPAQQADAPAFTEGGVAIPAGTTPAVGAPAVAPRNSAAPAAPASVQAGEPAGAAAAETVAQQLADAFADYEEFEVEDYDLADPATGVPAKYPVRVPKQYAQTAKRAYPRRAAFDRTMSRYSAADPVLRQIIEDGRIGPILPLLQRALDDAEYGDYVFKGYQRRTQGLPLIEQAVREAAAPPAAPQADFAPLDDSDPFFQERMRPYVEPLRQQYGELAQTVQALQAERQTAQQQQAEQARLNEIRAEQMREAHTDLARAFPGEYEGPIADGRGGFLISERDRPIWQRAIQYARDAGYVDAYGLRAGIVFAGQQVHLAEQERLAATASPAATALAQANAQHSSLAQQQAAAAARTVGGGAPANAPPPAPMAPPSTKNADGTMKPPGQFLREQQQYLAQNGALAS